MIPEPVPTDASGIEVVGIEIYSFPAGTVAVSNWEDGTKCELHVEQGAPATIHIVANVAGLRSLARHLLTLAQSGQEGNHFDYDATSGWFDTSDLGLRISRAWD